MAAWIDLLRHAARRARPLRAAAVVLIGLGIAAEAHLWWFTSFENLLGCDQRALWCGGGRAAPQLVALDRLKFLVKPNAEPVAIGRTELAQPDRNDTAEARHVQFAAHGPGVQNVRITNLARQRKLELTYAGRGPDAPAGQAEPRRSVLSERWYLSAGDDIRIGSARLGVESIEAGTITLLVRDDGANGGRRVRFGIRGLLVGPADAQGSDAPAAPPPCRAFGSFEDARQWFRGLGLATRFGLDRLPVVGPSFAHRNDRLSLGGAVDCAGSGASHLALGRAGPDTAGDVRVDAVSLVRRDDDFYLAPGNPPGGRLPAVALKSAADAAPDFSNIGWPLVHRTFGPLTGLTIGRTAYDLATRDLGAQGVEITLTPARRVSYFNPPGTAAAARGDPALASRADAPADETAAATPGREGVSRTLRTLHPLRDLSVSGFVATGMPGRGQRVETLSGGVGGPEEMLRIGVALTPLILLVLMTVYRAFAAPLRTRLRGRALLAVAGMAATTAAALAPELAWLTGRDPGIDVLMGITIANWLVASVAVVLLGGGGLLMALFWVAIVVLSAIGNLFLTALAMDGDASHWAAFLLRNKLMFLDLLPPWVFATVVADPRALRPWLQKLIGAGEPGFWMSVVRWGPVVLLFASMMLWLAAGGQAGVEGFNPIEFGKIASGVMLAAFLVSLDPARLWRSADGQPDYRRDQGSSRRFVRKIVSVTLGAILVLATASLFFVPTAQSDWSPLLIILLQGALIFAIYCLVSAFRWIPAELGWALRRRTVPARFLPVTTLYGAEIAAILAGGALVLLLHLWFAPAPVFLLLVFAAVVLGILLVCRAALGRYAVTNGAALLIIPLATALLLAVFGATTAWWEPPLVAAVGLGIAFAAARFAGWEIRWTRWNSALATWPILGFAVLAFALSNGERYALAWIGIPDLRIDQQQEGGRAKALEVLRHDYGASRRPAIVGRIISWTDISLDTEPPDVRYRDFGLQVIRSRAVMAAAPCDVDQAVRPAEPMLRSILAGVAGVGRAVLRVFGRLGDIETGLCGPIGGPGPEGGTERPAAAAGRDLYDGSDPMRVPVVQFDFPAAFLIGRFGVGFGVVLCLAQASLVLLGAIGFLRVLHGPPGSEPDTRVRRFLSIVLLSCVTLFALHWLISWCNVLGLLPVMGQPMLWLSAGVSHQILLVFPCVIAALVALRYVHFAPLDLRFGMPPR